MCSASRAGKLQNTHGDLLVLVLRAQLAESSHPERCRFTASLDLAGLDPNVTDTVHEDFQVRHPCCVCND